MSMEKKLYKQEHTFCLDGKAHIWDDVVKCSICEKLVSVCRLCKEKITHACKKDEKNE